MAKIRVTRELLEHLLDLPEGVTITAAGWIDRVDEVPVVCFYVEGPPPFHQEVELALQYEETEAGTSLVSAIPVTG